MNSHARIQQMYLGMRADSIENLRAILFDFDQRLAHLESVAPEVQPHQHTYPRLDKNGWVERLTSLPIPEPREETPQSEERPATTEPATTEERWDAEASTRPAMLALLLSAPVDTASLVALVFECAVQRGALPRDEQILALAAQARSLTSQSQDSKPFVGHFQSDVAALRSRSNEAGQ